MKNSTEYRILGKCPVCGEGDIIRVEHGYCCDAKRHGNGRRCGFIIHNRHHGIEFDDCLVRKLITDGYTDEMTMWNVNGQPFQARFIIVNGKVDVEIKSHYLQGRRRIRYAVSMCRASWPTVRLRTPRWRTSLQAAHRCWTASPTMKARSSPLS